MQSLACLQYVMCPVPAYVVVEQQHHTEDGAQAASGTEPKVNTSSEDPSETVTTQLG